MFAGLPAILVIAARRLAAQRGLALAASLGLVAAVALTLSIPLYADAVYHRIFLQQVLADGQAAGGAATRPPFAFLFEYEGAWDGGLQWEAIQPVDAYLSSQAPAGLGLPQELGVRHFRTDVLKLFPYDDAQYADTRDPLTWVHFSYLEDLEAHATVLEGRFPRPAGPASTEPVEALASQALATRLGLQVGELYITFQRSPAPGNRIIQIPVAIAGLWQPAEPADDYWCCPNAALEDLLFVPEATFRDRISRDLDDEIYVAKWYLIMNAADVHTNDAGPLAARIRSVWQRAATLLPNTRLTVSPLENLENYQRTAAALTVLLYAFSVPILGLVLAFVSLTAGLTAEGQRGEMAVLRSRGATVFQVAGIAVLESLLLGSIGLALGWPAGQLAARLIGSARSFLDFSAAPDLRVVMTPPALGFGLAALALALVAYVVPTLSAARHTVITFKQERARLLRAAWWQRAGLDLLLLALAGYGFYVLRRQGGLTLALPGGPAGGDPFQNPLLFLVPALAGAALTLAVLRVVPAAAGGAAWLIGRTRSVGLLLAARHLARTPGSYYPPLALLVLTLNLSVYTASLAQTLDDHLVAQTYYAIGADMRVDELGELTGNPDSGFGPAEADGGGARWLLLPVAEYLNVPEVRAATRVGEYMASAQLGGSHQAGTFVGIDRLDFPQVAYWRRDFAPESLGALMNRLALNWNGVLVPRDLLASHALGVGDPLRISVNLPSRLIHLDVTIAGAFDLFPGWDPADGWVYVGNLGYLFESAGTEYPSSVWMRTAPQAAPEAIADGMRQLGVSVLDWQAAVPQVQAEQSRPERQGLFGLLSVGFVASAVLTVVGFGLYALFSSRRRFIELGVLRAMGLSSRQMGTFVAWELGILIVTGLAAGTAIGVWLSREFIPHLQIQAGPAASLPPFVVVIAWPAVLQMYALFGLLFVGTLATLAASLRRMRVFESVKLGEAT